ncbi:NADP-dependent oxidoreductase [Candidatus Woesebacteria bacterium]|nr:NADP-dependent oxidoreductase [Candidatus Woesebacteria bacterium]
MKAAQINKYGGSDVVEINQNAPKPVVSAGKILVKVHAAGVNPFDWKVREGYMQKMISLKFPSTLGGDFSGVVAEVGEGVSDFKTGDEVYGQSYVFGGGGTFAEFVLADPKNIAIKPKKLSRVEAGALPLAGISAYQALVDHINLSKGQKLLIHGGAGGIGSIAIQIAKHMGAYVVTTVSADDKQFAKESGADEMIDYKNQKFEDLLHAYDAVFDTVGGETYKRSFKVLKKNGVIVSMLEQPNQELMQKYGVKALAQGTKVTNEHLAKLADLVDNGIIIVHVDKTFILDQAGEALEYLKTGHPRGKVVLTV